MTLLDPRGKEAGRAEFKAEDPGPRSGRSFLLLRRAEPKERVVAIIEEELRRWERREELGFSYSWPTSETRPSFPGRRESVRCASEMGPEARALVPHIEACFQLGDQLLDVLAAEALWRVAGRRSIDVLLAALDEPLSPDGRGSPWSVPRPTEESLEALRVLGGMGPAALDALPAIERLLADEHAAPLREAATAVVTRIRRRE